MNIWRLLIAGSQVIYRSGGGGAAQGAPGGVRRAGGPGRGGPGAVCVTDHGGAGGSRPAALVKRTRRMRAAARLKAIRPPGGRRARLAGALGAS